MNIPKHIKEHAALGLNPPEKRTLIVGDDNLTITEAIQYIIDNASAPTEVYSGVFGGTAGVTQYDDAIAFSGLTTNFNDFFGTTRANTIVEQIWVELNNDGHYRAIDRLVSTSEMQMEAGYEGITASGLSYKLFTMERWTILLSAGEHELDIEKDLSALSCILTIKGQGRLSSSLYLSGTGFGTGGLINPPSAGGFSMTDLTLVKANQNITIGNGPFAGVWSKLSVGLICDFYNVGLRTMEGATQADIINIDCARLSVSALDLSGKDNIFVAVTDGATVNGVNFSGNTAGEVSFAINCNRWQCTKPVFVNGYNGFVKSGVTSSPVLKIGKDDTITGGVKEAFISGVQTGFGININNEPANAVSELIAYIRDCTVDTITSNHATVYQTNCSKKDKTATTQTIISGGIFN